MEDMAMFFMIVLILACCLITPIYGLYKKNEIEGELDNIINNSVEISSEEFMKLRTAKAFNGKYQPYISSGKNFAGVYILHNCTKEKYYVGQSKTVFSRVNNHLTGKGNGDVYVDYRNGDDFSIILVPLSGSGFYDLDSLERHFIEYYHAYDRGYNKTRGNR